jgi:hypothetical protein
MKRNHYQDFLPSGFLMSALVTGLSFWAIANGMHGLRLAREMNRPDIEWVWVSMVGTVLSTLFVYALTGWHWYKARAWNNTARKSDAGKP